jgi:general secretion pathway protein K
MALFIVALVATISYVVLARLTRDTQRTTLLLRHIQAELYAQGAIAWAMDQLRNNWEEQQIDHVIDSVPIKLPVRNVNGYRISSIIYDMQARFNVNNLLDQGAQEGFQRLLQLVDPNLSVEKIRRITLAIIDWIKPSTGETTHDQYYLRLPTSYRAAHRPMLTVSELRLVQGITPSLFSALQPYIVALPSNTQINVQTAPVIVLMTLSETITLEIANVIELARGRLPFVSIATFTNLPILKNQVIHDDKLTVSSHYFLLETDVIIEKQHLALYTLLERVTKGKKAAVNIVWQSKGV